MIHLFKKVYLCLDYTIDMRRDRIVVSVQNGFNALSLIDNGVLLHYCSTADELVDGKFSSYEEFFDFVFGRATQTNSSVMIYADQSAFLTIAAAWFKLILPNAVDDDIRSLIQSYCVRYSMFYRSMWSSRDDSVFNIDMKNHNNIFSDRPIKSDGSFIEKVLPWVGVEFILATYLRTGLLKNELKQVLQPLVRKDLEKYVFEAKELFLTHFITERFAVQLGLDKVYTLENAHEIVHDQSKYARLFLDPSRWAHVFMDYESHGKRSINFENFSEQDIEDLKTFATMWKKTWTTEASNDDLFKKAEMTKLSFIPALENFTDEFLDKFVEIESTSNYITGPFFCVDQITVNNFLVHDILNNYNQGRADKIRKYSLVE